MRTSLGLLVLMVGLAARAADLSLTVQVEGVGGQQLKNVLAYLDIEKEKGNPELLVSRLRRLHARAPEQIRRALQPFGYYRVRVDAELERDGSTWEARYRVEPGEAVEVGAVDLQITGEGQYESALARDFPLQPGDVLVHARYEEGRRELQRVAAELGYLDAQFTEHQVRVDLAAYTATVALHFDTGPRYYFGPVHFVQDVLDDALLARYVTFKPGEPYSVRSVLDLQSALSASGYFGQVEVKALREEAKDRRVPLEVRLTRGKRNM